YEKQENSNQYSGIDSDGLFYHSSYQDIADRGFETIQQSGIGTISTIPGEGTTIEEKALRLVPTIVNLLHDGNGWCKGTIAQNKYGESVSCYDPTAIRYCLMGAVVKASIPPNILWTPEFESLRGHLYWSVVAMERCNKVTKRILRTHGLTNWNDLPQTTYSQVLISLLILKQRLTYCITQKRVTQ
ncbi:MAG TPA: hypothetical protein VNZ45_03675, partial [Bacteroidia bacterium]|nr:hypothetical protein [Bacteroidia bacterium]